MLKWGIALAAGVLLGIAGEVRAQLPKNGNGLTFVPVDTSRGLSTPIPTFGKPPEQGSFFSRLYDALASIIPFAPQKKPALPGPYAPTMKLPQNTQSKLAPPLQPTTSLPKSIKLPQLPTPISGTIK